jgi:transglycosylase-like protein with SLT domain/putative peptidoglycan binding protein/LysM domain-containing protein
MRRIAVVGVALSIGVFAFAQDISAANPRIAAVQVALRAHGFDPGPIDGVPGPLTRGALASFQRTKNLRPDGSIDRPTRRAFGARGRPLLGQRELAVGAVGWDVAVLEFRLRRFGLGARAVDGRFTRKTAAALRRFQRSHGLVPDGIAGPHTFRRLARRGPVRFHVVQPGESFFSIAARYRVSPWLLARKNGIQLTNFILPGQRFVLPAGAKPRGPVRTRLPATRDSVRAAIDRWAQFYAVDPALARALAWMESGFQHDVVSSVGAIGVMQLLPETWEFVDSVLLGFRTPRTYEGNVRAGVRYLRWQLDYFGGNVRLALAGWYQGARAVGEVGLYEDTKLFVRVVLSLYGTV